MHQRRSRHLAMTAVLVVTAAPMISLAAPATAAETDEATASVFHGVPGLTVDVYADGEELLPDLEPGTIAPPAELPAGSHDIAVFADGEGPDGTPAIEDTVDVPAGANATLVAHLDTDGEPTLTAFANDLDRAADGQGRLTVRHVAAAPAVDVRADDAVVFEGLENPGEESTDLDAGTLGAEVALAGEDDAVLGPADVAVEEGVHTIVYAWGSAEDDNLALKTDTIDLGGAPNAVPAGGSGVAADQGGGPTLWSIGLAALAALGLAESARRFATAKR